MAEPMSAADIAALPYRPCVGLMVLNRDGEVFAGQRLDARQEAWQMPQGGIDPGEAPLEAALRELWEETGITRDRVTLLAESADWINYDLPVHLVPRLWKGRYRGQTQRWFAFRFLGGDDEINIQTEHPEFSTWRWIGREDLLESIVPFKRGTYAKVLKEFAGLI